MDKLDHIFELQKGFQDKLKRERGLEGIPMETWLQKQTLAMISELAELLEEVNFKWWKNPHELRPDCVREELSDILHFFVSMCIEAGMTADDLYRVYVGKNRENHLRQEGLSRKPGYEVHPQARPQFNRLCTASFGAYCPRRRSFCMKKTACLALLMAAALALGGCAVSAEPAPAPAPEGATARAQVDWPKERLETDENGVPVLDVYVVADEQVERVDVETYVEGVLAGEMKNDWPLEALKAQAILARTFVLKFLADKQSKYEGADISTDIEEAQAYDASAVNDRIRQVVSETEGLVLSAGGELPYAWFHAHSGGLTALAREGLGWDKDEPPYTQIVPGNEPESATGEKDAQMLREAQHWQASFPYEEVEAACETLGVDVTLEDGAKLTIEERGDSGRAVRLGLNGQSVDASDLRIALGSTKMRSTLITSLRAQEGKLVMAGTGYGHGVGMSQWGAYGMAQAGSTAEEIVTYYFKDVSIEKLW